MNRAETEYQLAAYKRDQRLANIALGLLIVAVTVLCAVFVVAT